MLDARSLIGELDVVLITLDTLRYDVAERAMLEGRTPGFRSLLPGGRWERRHSSGSFTYAAHHAFFAGFLPTPTVPGTHPRLFASRFEGSETTTPQTAIFEEADIVSGLAGRGYRTICVGGVGFFNRINPLGSVLPDLFHEAHWSPALGVTDPHSTRNQVDVAVSRLAQLPQGRRAFLFLNVSALHQPNCIFSTGANEDSPHTQADALAYVDGHLPPLFEALRRRGGALCVVTSDHGTAYGEDGYYGHRLGHSTVWDVPYAEFILTEA
ncbi:MAG: STM4013/SEN3800 family hydrolase [Planctomycetota bacterium]